MVGRYLKPHAQIVKPVAGRQRKYSDWQVPVVLGQRRVLSAPEADGNRSRASHMFPPLLQEL